MCESCPILKAEEKLGNNYKEEPHFVLCVGRMMAYWLCKNNSLPCQI